MLEVAGLQWASPDGTFVTPAFAFTATPGQCVGVVGPNGTGKTTLLKLIAGVLRPSAGTCSWLGSAFRAPDSGPRIELCFGGDNHVYPALSGIDNLLFDLLLSTRMSRSTARQIAAEALRHWDLADSESKPVSTYSSGMKQRLHLARAFARPADIVLLDEPTRGLDTLNIGRLADTIAAVLASGGLVLTTSHEESFLQQVATESVTLGPGILSAALVPDVHDR